MDNPNGSKGSAPKNPYTVEIDIDASAPVDWASALKEFESYTPGSAPAEGQAEAESSNRTATDAQESAAAKAAEAAAAAERKRKAEEGRKRYEELCKKPSMTMESGDLAAFDEFSEILSAVNTASNLLNKFVSKHPYLIAPNIYRIWEDNLKETSTVMFREFHNLRNGRQKKTYDKRYVCTQCHTVCMLPLPEGLCDECRSRTTGGGGAY